MTASKAAKAVWEGLNDWSMERVRIRVKGDGLARVLTYFGIPVWPIIWGLGCGGTAAVMMAAAVRSGSGWLLLIGLGLLFAMGYWLRLVIRGALKNGGIEHAFAFYYTLAIILLTLGTLGGTVVGVRAARADRRLAAAVDTLAAPGGHTSAPSGDRRVLQTVAVRFDDADPYAVRTSED